MNIYKIEQDHVSGWDTYDSAVVLAESEDEARNMHPNGDDPKRLNSDSSTWPADRSKVTVTLLGVASGTEDPITAARVVCASFNAG